MAALSISDTAYFQGIITQNSLEGMLQKTKTKKPFNEQKFSHDNSQSKV